MTISSPVSLEVTIAARPRVVRSRPAGGDDKIDRDQTISIRFSTPMDRRVTRAAVRVSGLDPLKDAHIGWLESGRVLVLDPDQDFAFGEKVTVTILGAARSAAGVALGDDARGLGLHGDLHRRAQADRQEGGVTLVELEGHQDQAAQLGHGTGSAPWLAVEKYYLKLLNCTRTGGWVLADGSCKGYGSGTTRPTASRSD